MIYPSRVGFPAMFVGPHPNNSKHAVVIIVTNPTATSILAFWLVVFPTLAVMKPPNRIPRMIENPLPKAETIIHWPEHFTIGILVCVSFVRK